MVLISALAFFYVKRRRSNALIDEVPVVGETRSNASIDDVVDETQRNASIDEVISEVDEDDEFCDVVCLNMPCHNRLMKTKVMKVLYAIDKRIKIFDLKAIKRSSVDCLIEAVKKCSLVLIGTGENANNEEIRSFRSDAQIAFSEKRGRREEQVVPVLLNGSLKDVPEFLQHLNALDLRNRKDDSYEDEIARLRKAVRGVFARAA